MESTPNSSSTSPKVLSSFALRLKERQNKSPLPLNSPLIKSPATTNDLILYPASQTIGESLSTLASTTAKQLEHIWDEVGYTPEERACQISELLSDIKVRCDAKVAEEQGVAEQFKNAIADAKEERITTCAALKIEVDDNIAENQGEQSLSDELASLEATLANLRSASAAAKRDLSESKNMLIDIHNALGSQLPKEWEDVTSDLTESRRQAFHNELQEMREIEKTRTKAVVQLLLDCESLLRELKFIPSDATSKKNDASTQSALDAQILGSLVHNDDGTHTLKSRIESPNNTGISASILDKLTKRLAELSQEKKRRKKYLGDLGEAIASLWEKLRVSEEVQKSFADGVKGLGMDTIEKGEQELQRLTDLKAKMIGNLIEEAREKIKSLLEETYTSADQLQSFQALEVTDESLFTDELLSEHEEFILLLQQKADQMRPLLKFIEKREGIIRERMEYEELQKDPDRLKQRGAALTKQLMKEEKMSKRIKKDLPKYTDVLTKRLRDWESAHGESFLYKGSCYLDRIKKQEETWQAYRNNEIQIKLKKKQEGMAYEKNLSNKSHFKPLPGKKREKPVQGRLVRRPSSRARSRPRPTRPLSDSTKQNQVRNESREQECSNGKNTGYKKPQKTHNSC